MMKELIMLARQEATASQWLLYFYIYCFAGWVWESCYVSVCERKWVNRGFMKGPLIPIYGSGAILLLVLTLPIRGRYVLMVLAGIVGATILEYATGAVMEALFKVRYWDYTGKFLNINGYICFTSTVCWGFMTLLVTGFIHPRIAEVVSHIPPEMLVRVDFLITACAGADFATSFKAAIDFRNLLIRAEAMRDELTALRSRMEELQNQLAETARETVTAAKDKTVETVIAAKDKTIETVAAARDKTVETVAAAKDKAVETMTAVKDKTVETVAAAKDKTVETVTAAKDKTVETVVAVKDKTVETVMAVKDKTVETVTAVRDTTAETVTAAKDKTVETVTAAKDKTVETVAAARERAAAELRELKWKEQLNLTQLRTLYSRSIGRLLERNPGAVSFHYREVFPSVKQAIQKSMRRDRKTEE